MLFQYSVYSCAFDTSMLLAKLGHVYLMAKMHGYVSNAHK